MATQPVSQLTSSPRPQVLFSPRRVVITFSLQQRLAEGIPDSWEEELAGMLNRHIDDWEDKDVPRGASLFSVYYTSNGTQVWVITEKDRSCTTVLLPEDY